MLCEQDSRLLFLLLLLSFIDSLVLRRKVSDQSRLEALKSTGQLKLWPQARCIHMRLKQPSLAKLLSTSEQTKSATAVT